MCRHVNNDVGTHCNHVRNWNLDVIMMSCSSHGRLNHQFVLHIKFQFHDLCSRKLELLRCCLSEIKLNSNLIQFLFWLHFSVNVWLADWQWINKNISHRIKEWLCLFSTFWWNMIWDFWWIEIRFCAVFSAKKLKNASSALRLESRLGYE